MTARGLKRYLGQRVQFFGAFADGTRGAVVAEGYLVAVDGNAAHLAPRRRAKPTHAIDLEVAWIMDVVPAVPELRAHPGGKVCRLPPQPAPLAEEGPARSGEGPEAGK